jgi:acyl-CoA thioester hydrolase
MGNSSMTVGHRIVDSNDATKIHADGSVTMVWINTKTGRPVPLPQVIRDAVADAQNG